MNLARIARASGGYLLCLAAVVVGLVVVDRLAALTLDELWMVSLTLGPMAFAFVYFTAQFVKETRDGLKTFGGAR